MFLSLEFYNLLLVVSHAGFKLAQLLFQALDLSFEVVLLHLHLGYELKVLICKALSLRSHLLCELFLHNVHVLMHFLALCVLGLLHSLNISHKLISLLFQLPDVSTHFGSLHRGLLQILFLNLCQFIEPLFQPFDLTLESHIRIF
jgi:hypothetical protein